MIRKAIIWALATSAAVCAVGWLATVSGYIAYEISRWQPSDIGIGAGAFYWANMAGDLSMDDLSVEVNTGPILLPAFLSSPWGAGRFQFVLIPLWIPFLLFAAYPTIALIRGPVRRWRRRRAGLCIKCGYDLMGNESGVCSECGKDVGTT